MASIICMGISLVTGVARVGVFAGKTALNVAMLPPEIVGKGLTVLKQGISEAADKADKGLQEVGRKCGL